MTQVGLGPPPDAETELADEDLVIASVPPASDVVPAQASVEEEYDPDAYLKLEEGKVLARKYRLVKPAGFGGMAQLWVAKNESTAAEVCVKVLVPDASDEESVARFRREAHAAARLSHRAIVSVFDLFELDVNGNVAKSERPHALAIVMELLNGETLTDHLMKQGELHVDDMLDIAIPMCGALSHAHKAGVVHRDIKPDNVFLARDPDGTVIPKILDFGVSKIVSTGNSEGLTKTGVMLGTPSFMSPEQAKGSNKVDARSDVFSAGIVMMMMLTGKNPFEDEGGFHSIVQNIIEKPITRPDGLPDAIWDVINRSLMKDPDARWNDGTELQLALRKASGRRSLSDPSIPLGPTSAHHGPSDSKISVPPVDTGQSSLPDSQELAAIPGASPERRAKMIKIVAGIVMASFLIMGLALIRAALSAPGKDAGKATAATAAPSPSPPPTPIETAAPTATATATATASTTTTPTATIERTVEPTPSAAPTVDSTPKPKPTTAPAAPAKPPAKKDPSQIANTPGF